MMGRWTERSILRRVAAEAAASKHQSPALKQWLTVLALWDAEHKVEGEGDAELPLMIEDKRE